MKYSGPETVEIVTVTPQMAERWLTLNANNRKLSAKRINQYARALRDGRFLLSNDAIVFDNKGRLINAQHRLHAVVQAGEPATFIVARNYAPKAFAIMDRQFTRRTAQLLKAKYSNSLAGVAHFGILYMNGEFPISRTMNPEPQECLEFIETNPEALRSVALIHQSRAAKLGAPGFLAFLHFYYSKVADPIAVDQFFYNLGSGAGLNNGSPELTLRNRILTGEKTNLRTRQAMTIKAIKAALLGKKLSVCKWTATEQFPSLELPA